MSAMGKFLRRIEGGQVAFWCPGCKTAHALRVGVADKPCWTFNGSEERPTFAPSVLVTSGHYVTGHVKDSDGCWCKYNAEHPEDPSGFTCERCHSFVIDGAIQFLADSTHELAGKTVPLPEFP